MIQKKVCMLGAFAVGKTSLVERHVHSKFTEKYQTTIGVKIDKKVMAHEGQEVTLVLWDMVGKDDYTDLAISQLRGAAGYVLVLDPTRPATLDVGTWIQREIEKVDPDLPFVVALNKHDLVDRWSWSEAQHAQIAALETAGWHFVNTSAKSGEGVEEVFESILRSVMSGVPDA